MFPRLRLDHLDPEPRRGQDSLPEPEVVPLHERRLRGESVLDASLLEERHGAARDVQRRDEFDHILDAQALARAAVHLRLVRGTVVNVHGRDVPEGRAPDDRERAARVGVAPEQGPTPRGFVVDVVVGGWRRRRRVRAGRRRGARAEERDAASAAARAVARGGRRGGDGRGARRSRGGAHPRSDLGGAHPRSHPDGRRRAGGGAAGDARGPRREGSRRRHGRARHALAEQVPQHRRAPAACSSEGATGKNAAFVAVQVTDGPVSLVSGGLESLAQSRGTAHEARRGGGASREPLVTPGV